MILFKPIMAERTPTTHYIFVIYSKPVRSMSLFPMTKEQRIQVYSLATLYKLKKESIGKGRSVKVTNSLANTWLRKEQIASFAEKQKVGDTTQQGPCTIFPWLCGNPEVAEEPLPRPRWEWCHDKDSAYPHSEFYVVCTRTLAHSHAHARMGTKSVIGTTQILGTVEGKRFASWARTPILLGRTTSVTGYFEAWVGMAGV